MCVPVFLYGWGFSLNRYRSRDGILHAATSQASGESDRIAQHGREQVHQTVLSIGSLAEDVTTNVAQVEELAQQSPPGADQVSAASQELSRLSVDLNTLVARFSV
ncbi:hypothetical protein BSF40_03780 [Pseudomonas sp. ACN5]|nr:hypothetical protein BSF40_03780 [Pseudomonas sp. ACN5]